MITRVLIADDDPSITEIHQHYVSKVEGFEVVGLSNTLEDTELQIRVMEPQLILLDIYFPEGSGIDLLKQIRNKSKALDIIPITAAKEVRLLQEALRVGVFAYILKPVVFSRFEHTLQRYNDESIRSLICSSRFITGCILCVRTLSSSTSVTIFRRRLSISGISFSLVASETRGLTIFSASGR